MLYQEPNFPISGKIPIRFLLSLSESSNMKLDTVWMIKYLGLYDIHDW
jgi:hypothetical protein